MQTALLLIDVVDEYLKPWGNSYIGNIEAERVIKKMQEQIKSAVNQRIPVIYVAKDKHIITDLPHQESTILTKPSLSAFYDTPLEVLLRRLNVNKIIVAGACTETSILFTLYDAKIKGFEVILNESCIATSERMYHTFALVIIRDALKIKIH